MLDQAAALRSLVRDRIADNALLARPPKVYTLAVTSGKGGVGKTSLAVNLALLLSRSGRQVRIVDADFGLSNAEVLLGTAPTHTLDDVARGLVDVRDAWVETTGGIKLLSSGSGLEDMANIDGAAGVDLFDRILASASDGDVIIVDTAPGINNSVVSMLSLADEVMMITTPEPTSIADSYAALKVLTSRVHDADITLIANCCSSPTQAAAVAKGLDSVCGKFLARSFQRYEYLPTDQSVGRAIRMQKPLVSASGHSLVEPWLRKIAIRLDGRIRSRLAAACEVGV